LVREDEPAAKFVQKIHDEKVEALQKIYWEKNDTTLFTSPELKMLNDMLKCSPEDWEPLLVNSVRERVRLKKMISFLRGANAFETEGKMNAPTS